MSKNVEKNKKTFLRKGNLSPSLVSQLEDACKGLIYISETDAPVTAFTTGPDFVAGESIIQQLGGKANEPVSEIDFDQFFERLTTVKDWHGEREKLRAKKFLDLQKLIEENLSNRKVFRIGEIRLRIFAVGTDSDGRLVGIETNAVET